MRGTYWKTLAMATVATMALSACGGGDAADDTAGEQDAAPAQTQTEQESGAQAPANLPEGVTQAQFEQGQQLFSGQGICYSCHGPDATGTQLAPDLTDSEWINVSGRNFDEIVQLIQTGVPQPQEHPGPMPPMGGANLSQEQVEALAAYVVGLGGS